MRDAGRTEQDAGLGLVTVMMVMGVISALAITATTLTISNLGDARRDRQALTALASSEAGVARAISFLRTGNLGSLTCARNAGGVLTGCDGPGPSWTSRVAPVQVGVDGTVGTCTGTADCYRVWIETVRPYTPRCSGRNQTPPTRCTGRYRVHSTGISVDRAARKVVTEVEASPYSYPLGVFSEGYSGNGNVGVHRQSLFVLGCMINRQRDDQSGSGTRFDWDAANGRPVLDLFHDQPSAAHATAQVSTSNGSCTGGGGGGPIHSASVRCNPDFRYDQSGQGGVLAAGDGCHGAYVRSDGTRYPTTSLFTEAELSLRYGYRPRGLTDAQYDALRSQAVSTGTYNLPVNQINARLTALVAQGVASPVLYWDSGDIGLAQGDFPTAFTRAINDQPGCGTPSVTVVVAGPGNDLSYSGGNTAPFLVAAIFVPDGVLTGTGGRNTIGTVFAKTVDLGGNIDFHMDECFASNPPGGTVDVEVVDWREDDAQDIS